ncbi:MAG: class II fructose-bisphosphate aldolase family protein [Chloroflexota bacterium]|nr:class II fructose-bisphosphate aldolase family protein [Chloroflexota bacterium]
MALVPAHVILADARRRGYGIPCLLAGNLEMTIGQIQAAEELDAPLILAYNSGVTPQVSIALAMPAIANAARQARTPVATILDHGGTLDEVKEAIALGSSSVMFDGSALPFEENVQATAEAARLAHVAGISVEGELGAVGGSSVELGASDAAVSSMTDPDLAAEFVARTGVDVLAVSFGNVHGVYRGVPRLDLERVRAIAALVDVPLAMHGASGLTDDQYPPIIRSGISKVNYYTAMARAVSHDLRDMLADAPEEGLVYHRIISASIDGFYAKTKELLTLLGAAGMARNL